MATKYVGPTCRYHPNHVACSDGLCAECVQHRAARTEAKDKRRFAIDMDEVKRAAGLLK
jgi:hypothetical protein